MKISAMSTLSVNEVNVIIHNKLIEEHSAQTQAFDYPNYRLDQRPKILVLGYWRNPDTTNPLLGGINLNYLTSDELERVRRALPIILKAKNLKSRYWVGRKLLPDIFKMAYRTYNNNYIKKVSPGEITYGDEKDEKDEKKAAAGLDAGKLKKAVEILKHKHDQEKELEEPKEEPKKEIPWRTLAKALKKKKEEPKALELPPLEEPIKKKPKKGLTRKRVEELPEPEINLELPPLLGGEEKPDLTSDDEGTEGILDKIAEIDEPNKLKESRHPVLGFVWPSPEAYREWHRPAAFLTTPALSENKKRPLLAVYDILTNEVLIDRVEDHATIIQEANWDYSHVVRLLPVDGKIVPLHDNLPDRLVKSILKRIPQIVIENLLY